MDELPEPKEKNICTFPKHKEIENLNRTEINMEMESIKDISRPRKGLSRELHS